MSKIHAEVQRILADPGLQNYFSPQLLQPMIGTPEQFGAFIRSDAQKWGTIIRNANLSLQ